ncbi:MAG TPA: c-type cytochrome [Sandaracinaceae bacterium]
MTEHAASAPANAHESHEHPSYVKIWAILVVLLIVSVVGPMLEVPIVTLITAFGVAIVKAYLVVRYFMHLPVEPKYVGYLLVTMVAFMLLFFAGTAPDVLRHEGQQWTNRAARAEVERALAAVGSTGEPAVTGPFDAAREFATTCGVCHGTGGAGDGPAAATLDPRPANFTDAAFWATRDRAHIVRVITEGGAAVGRSPLMPGFGARYDRAQIEALADHVVGLAPEGAIAGGDAGDAGANASDAGVPAAEEPEAAEPGAPGAAEAARESADEAASAPAGAEDAEESAPSEAP